MPDNRDAEPGATSFFGLRGRILAISLLPMLLATIVLSVYFSQRSIRDIEKGLYRQGTDLVSRLSEAAPYDLHAGQPIYLKRLLDYERAIHDAEAIGLRNAKGEWWLISGRGTLLESVAADRRETHWRQDNLLFFRHTIDIDPAFLDFTAAPNASGGTRVIGQVVAVIRTTRIDTAKSELIIATLSLLSLLVVAAGALAWRLSARFSNPLAEIIRAVKAIAGGELHARVQEVSSGEIRQLEKGVNRMAERLEANTRDLETRIGEATANLLRQKQAADAATVAKSRFLAAASHDLRQPLHTLMLLIGALRERLGATDKDALHLAENIETSAHSMGSLLNALLDLSRLDAGIIVARPECFHVADLLASIERQFAPLAAEKGVRLRVHDSNLTIFSDPALMERVIANLVANAIRYTTRGSVLLGVRRVQQDWARFEVWDTGIGIAPEDRERIFDEFFQLDNQERGYGKGLGLGLSIVNRLVRLLGSGVAVKSIPGRGSRFSVRAIRCELPPGWSKSLTEEATPIAHRPLVAFIDDDPQILEAMLALFEQWDMEAATGEDALSVIRDCRQLGHRPDIIISDYRLAGGRTGIEAIADLRVEFGPKLPALLITGDTAPSTIQILDESGLPVLHKPLKPAKLRALLSHMLTSGQSAETAPD